MLQQANRDWLTAAAPSRRFHLLGRSGMKREAFLASKTIGNKDLAVFRQAQAEDRFDDQISGRHAS